MFPVPSLRRELFYGLIRIHVLLHASHEPIFGLAMMEELAHHGYRIGPGPFIRSCTGWSAAVCSRPFPVRQAAALGASIALRLRERRL